MNVSRGRVNAGRLTAALGGVAAVTWILAGWLRVSNTTTVAMTFLLVVLVVAATSGLWIAIATSVAAVLAFNFYFLPPIGTLTIADPHNWVALFAFLAVSLVASNLSAVARARTEEAESRRDEAARLFDLSREVLMITDGQQAIPLLARSIARRFDLEYVALALPRESEWDVFEAGPQVIAIDPRRLTAAMAVAQTSLEFDAHARAYAGHRIESIDGHAVRLVPLRVGTKPIGLLAASGRPIEAGMMDTLAGVVAIAIERARLLEKQKAAELTRQSDELKTALLASIGHDLRTPLTAIRVAASNIKAPWLASEDRIEQSDLILAEVERLSRLFENIQEMARIDIGAIATEAQWVFPAEIVAAARDQVERTLRHHTVDMAIDQDVPIRLDPRLTAAALARLLENAAQYSPPGSTIQVATRVTEDGLEITVGDRGPGIAVADFPRLFDRYYRGAAAKSRASGTGMGLWIARELLAVMRGRVWAENRADGGAAFTILVPAAVRQTDAAAPTT